MAPAVTCNWLFDDVEVNRTSSRGNVKLGVGIGLIDEQTRRVLVPSMYWVHVQRPGTGWDAAVIVFNMPVWPKAAVVAPSIVASDGRSMTINAKGTNVGVRSVDALGGLLASGEVRRRVLHRDVAAPIGMFGGSS